MDKNATLNFALPKSMDTNEFESSANILTSSNDCDNSSSVTKNVMDTYLKKHNLDFKLLPNKKMIKLSDLNFSSTSALKTQAISDLESQKPSVQIVNNTVSSDKIKYFKIDGNSNGNDESDEKDEDEREEDVGSSKEEFDEEYDDYEEDDEMDYTEMTDEQYFEDEESDFIENFRNNEKENTEVETKDFLNNSVSDLDPKIVHAQTNGKCLI